MKPQKTPLSSFALIIVSTVLSATGQLLYKLAAPKLSFNIVALVTNVSLLLGILCYASAGILVILALRKGELSVIFPFVSLSFIWVLLISAFYLGEAVTPMNALGIGALVAGLVFSGGSGL